MMKTGLIHSVETLGLLDGPGLRTVFFMQGCNMRCIYCHNRDSLDIEGGRSCTVGEIADTALRYREYHGEDGGVTFSGGEPLLQAEFLIEAVKALRSRGIKTALDTSGSFYNEKTRILFGLVDLVILDIKHSDKRRYPELCRFPGENAFANLEYIRRNSVRYWIRQVVVGGYTDTEEQAAKLARLFDSGHKPEKIELLPYHETGREKWSACGEAYPLEGAEPPSAARMKLLREKIETERVN